MNNLLIYITFFHFLISAATGAAAPGYIGSVNAADQVVLLDFHNASCFYDSARFDIWVQVGLSAANEVGG